jgi:hypothetical protein
VDTHLAFSKDKIEKKEQNNNPKLSRRWSSIVQRLANNHTSYIISFRAKCEAGQEATGY